MKRLIAILLLAVCFLCLQTCTKSFHILPITRGNLQHLQQSFLLHAKAKGKGTTKSSTAKVRVRLLQDVKGIGQKGSIVFVSQSMYSNVMSQKKTAQKVDDGEMQVIEAKQQQAESEALDKAKAFATDIAALPALVVKRKVGKNNQLFGAVTTKMILDELRKTVSATAGLTNLAIFEVKDVESGETFTDLRRAGEFKVTLKVHQKIPDPVMTLQIISE